TESITAKNHCTSNGLVGVLPSLRLSRPRFRRLGASHIDDRGIHHVLDVGGVELLDHLNAGTAILGDLINVGALHQAQADIGVPQTVEGPALAFAINLEVKFAEDGVEEVVMTFRKDNLGRLRAAAFHEALKWHHSAPLAHASRIYQTRAPFR